MDTANILLIIASFLLFLATVMYAIATWRMNKIMNRQAEITKLQIYLNAQYAMIIGSHNNTNNLIHKVSKPFLDRFEEKYEKVLKNIFDNDTKVS